MTGEFLLAAITAIHDRWPNARFEIDDDRDLMVYLLNPVDDVVREDLRLVGWCQSPAYVRPPYAEGFYLDYGF